MVGGKMHVKKEVKGGEMDKTQISIATGSAAWAVAEKAGTLEKPAYFKYGEILVKHTGKTYSEGNLGDYGFCNNVAKEAANNKGVWV